MYVWHGLSHLSVVVKVMLSVYTLHECLHTSLVASWVAQQAFYVKK